MANAVEDALSRGSAEQQEKAQQVIQDARRDIQMTNISGDISPMEASSIVTNAQIIEDAKRNIPAATMENVETISSPLPTPSPTGVYDYTPVEVNPVVQNTIENIEQGSGNNYLEQNAVDRAVSRQEQESPQPESPEQSMER
jgi:hypothetical protein